MPSKKNLQDDLINNLQDTAYREMTNKKNIDNTVSFARKHPIICVLVIIVLVVAGILYYNSTVKTKNEPQTANNPTANTPNKPSVKGVNSKEESIKNGSTSPSILPAATGTKLLGPEKYPDPTKTPGAIYQNITKDDVCDSGYAQRVRNVPTLQKKRVYASYSMTYPQPAGAYEVDHFIPLSIGGSNDDKNLWPEPAEPRPGFREKDKVEFYLYNAVCSGKISLKDAQDSMKNDWYKVYQSISKKDEGNDPDGDDEAL